MSFIDLYHFPSFMRRSIHAASNDVLRHGEKRNIEEYFYRPHIFRETKYQRTVGKVLKADRILHPDKRRYPVSVEPCPIRLFSSRYVSRLRKLPWFSRRGKRKKKKKKSLWIFPFSRLFFLRAVEKCFTLEEIFSLSGKIDFLSLSFSPLPLSLSLSTSIDSFQFFKLWHSYPSPPPDYSDYDFVFLNYPRERIFNRCPLNRLPLLLVRRGEREKKREREREIEEKNEVFIVL